MEIKYQNVSYRYQNNASNLVLDDINVKIKKEKINGILGTIGSGKTTFVELMNALRCPTSGTIQIDDYLLRKKGTKVDIQKLRKEISFVFQDYRNPFASTVKEELASQLLEGNIETRIMDALKLVGMDASYLERNPNKFSTGEKQKIRIASVLMKNSKVLVFDEPIAGLDGISTKNFLKMLKILKNRFQKTIIIVTNDVNMVHKIADYLFVFHHGKLVLEGNKYEVFEHEKLESYGLMKPDIMEFSNQVLNHKKIRLGYRDDINDLIKDIYRHVSIKRGE